MSYGAHDDRYLRNMATLRRCQLTRDNSLPPEYFEKEDYTDYEDEEDTDDDI